MPLKLSKILFEEQEQLKVVVDPTLQLSQKDDPRLLFIRFGAFDPDQPSRIGLDAEFVRDVMDGKTRESGLSVFFVERKGDVWNIIPPSSRRAAYQTGGSYFQDMLTGIFRPAIANDEVYILRGKLIELVTIEQDYDEDIEYHTYRIGADGEPVLEPGTISIVQTLTTEEVLDQVKYNNGKLVGDYNVGWGSTKVRDTIFDYYREEEDEE